MVVFPNCKINLGLRILDKREDGFHNLETIFYPVKIYDALEIIKADAASDSIQFTSSGIVIDGDTDNNLCVKAYHLLKKDFPELPNIKMHLHKAIPLGAGLGGGSADASFTLKLINAKFQLNLSDIQLFNYALLLGSDCPFFILNKPCIATGRGETLKEIELNFSKHTLVIVNPGIHINTRWAFSQLSVNSKMSTGLLPSDRTTWVNDFEPIVFEKYPEVKKIKEVLHDSGAVYAAMSGSGSTVYGIFNTDQPIIPQFQNNYFVKTIQM